MYSKEKIQFAKDLSTGDFHFLPERDMKDYLVWNSPSTALGSDAKVSLVPLLIFTFSFTFGVNGYASMFNSLRLSLIGWQRRLAQKARGSNASGCHTLISNHIVRVYLKVEAAI